MARESAEDAIRRALAELEQTTRAAEVERAQTERRMRPPPFWPDRRAPRRWRQGDVPALNRREQE